MDITWADARDVHIVWMSGAASHGIRWMHCQRTNTIPYVRRALANHRRGVWFDSYGWEKREMV